MRLVTASLILASLVFSVGGVAIVGRAGNEHAAPATQSATPSQSKTDAKSDAKTELAPRASAAQCGVPKRPIRPMHFVGNRTQLSGTGKTMSLNTHGYNYDSPAGWSPTPVGTPVNVPEGTLPSGVTSHGAPPAAPAK
jgi:hypothetical protein